MISDHTRKKYAERMDKTGYRISIVLIQFHYMGCQIEDFYMLWQIIQILVTVNLAVKQ